MHAGLIIIFSLHVVQEDGREYEEQEEKEKEEEEEDDNDEVEDVSKSVDITLGDTEYVEQVTDQIISPNTPVTEWEEHRKKMEGQAETDSVLPLFSFDSHAEEEDEEEEEEEEEEEKELVVTAEQTGEEEEDNQEVNREEEEEEEEEIEDVDQDETHGLESDYSGSSCRTDEESVSLEWVKNMSPFSFLTGRDSVDAIANFSTEKHELLTHSELVQKLKVCNSGALT